MNIPSPKVFSSNNCKDHFYFSHPDVLSIQHLIPLNDFEVTKNLQNYSIYLSYRLLLKKQRHDKKMYEKYHCGKSYCKTYTTIRTCFESEEEFDAFLKETKLDSMMNENSIGYKLFPPA